MGGGVSYEYKTLKVSVTSKSVGKQAAAPTHGGDDHKHQDLMWYVEKISTVNTKRCRAGYG